MKTCTKCGEHKEVTEFSRHKLGKGGIRAACKLCCKSSCCTYRGTRKGKEAMNVYNASGRSKDARQRYRGTKRGYLALKWKGIKERCTGKSTKGVHIYFGLPYVSREVFVKWSLSQPAFHRLWDAYQAAGRSMKLAPSIDRIDGTKGYLLSNIQYLTQSENCSKPKTRRV